MNWPQDLHFESIGLDLGLALEVLDSSGSAYVATLAAAAVCSYLGLFTVMRRIVFTGAALAQLAAAGVGFAFFIEGQPFIPVSIRASIASWGPAVGSMVFSLLGVLGLQVRPHRHRSSPDALVGLVFAIAAAASVLFVWRSSQGLVALRDVLAGEVLLSGPNELFLLGFGLVVVTVVHMIYRRQFLLCSYDPEFARVLGLPERRYQMMLLGSIAIAVALALRVMGLVLVFAFLVIPPLAGLGLGRRLGEATRIAIATALAGTLIGFLLASHEDLPTAQTVTISLAGLLVLAKLGQKTAPTRWLVTMLLYGLAILSLVVAVRVMPVPGMGSGESVGHSHSGAVVSENGEPDPQVLFDDSLSTLAGGSDPLERRKAAQYLAELPIAQLSAMKPLLAATADEDDEVKTWSKKAIANIMQRSAGGRGRQMLSGYAKGDDVDIAYLAARYRVEIGDTRGLENLVAILGREDLAFFTAEEILEILKEASGGRDFGFSLDAESNADALKAWKVWIEEELRGGRVVLDSSTGRFRPA